ncbi:uncharacterized protein BDR25DRAFT_121529 [Lindgomyces ingoldianus]|uniref:Uncharacterized protein n=1 Tax=Lindgomyces ingoldianus TaxID=673940 RepID=A0ACB6R5C2_9PLEO|nr:uncharacterized protein BDR25DRAFT_121529 [Lindgomyces ingoldianus]KAF2474376.1 hypothetical protein BDR25DRAFT_121529 [Lindgomyces ingoldianus]
MVSCKASPEPTESHDLRLEQRFTNAEGCGRPHHSFATQSRDGISQPLRCVLSIPELEKRHPNHWPVVKFGVHALLHRQFLEKAVLKTAPPSSLKLLRSPDAAGINIISSVSKVDKRWHVLGLQADIHLRFRSAGSSPLGLHRDNRTLLRPWQRAARLQTFKQLCRCLRPSAEGYSLTAAMASRSTARFRGSEMHSNSPAGRVATT